MNMKNSELIKRPLQYFAKHQDTSDALIPVISALAVHLLLIGT